MLRMFGETMATRATATVVPSTSLMGNQSIQLWRTNQQQNT